MAMRLPAAIAPPRASTSQITRSSPRNTRHDHRPRPPGDKPSPGPAHFCKGPGWRADTTHGRRIAPAGHREKGGGRTLPPTHRHQRFSRVLAHSSGLRPLSPPQPGALRADGSRGRRHRPRWSSERMGGGRTLPPTHRPALFQGAGALVRPPPPLIQRPTRGRRCPAARGRGRPHRRSRRR
jgi:hypothetical protein